MLPASTVSVSTSRLSDLHAEIEVLTVVTVKCTGYDAVLSGRSSSTFQWNALVLFPASAYFLFGLLFYPDDGGSMSFRNVGKLLSDYTASHPKMSCFYLLLLRFEKHF
jgi:hypothetical protein